MQPKLLYVLVSSDKDLYLEQFFVSSYSVKYYMPDSHIVLLLDRLTKETLKGKRSNFVKFVDELVVIDLEGDKYTPQQRSRILKTSARNHVDGDFIFIDCDTIVKKPFDFSLLPNFDICACWDTHSRLKDNPFYFLCDHDARRLDWSLEGEEEYFNSGVIYVKDNATTKDFYKRWNSNCLEGFDKGVCMDQPTFAKTNAEKGHIIHKLDDIWNCEFKYGIKYLQDAFVLHYLCTNKDARSRQPFILNEASELFKIKQLGDIPEDLKIVVKDCFKGIANVSILLAGNDINYTLSKEYAFIKNHKYIMKFLCFFSNLYQLICKVFSLILKCKFSLLGHYIAVVLKNVKDHK